MVNAWLSNCRSILAFMKKIIKDAKREREREKEEMAWGTVEQFLQLKVYLKYDSLSLTCIFCNKLW